MNRARRFLQEVNRRNVFRAGAAYVVAAWLIAQVADLLFDAFEAPEWAIQLILLALAIGLPVALILSWAYEITAEGIVPADDVHFFMLRVTMHHDALRVEEANAGEGSQGIADHAALLEGCGQSRDVQRPGLAGRGDEAQG